MPHPAGPTRAVDDLLEEFAAALVGEVGARAAEIADGQAALSDDAGVAANWRRIADKARARCPATIDPRRPKTGG
ncbi:MAG: hypothetical protein J0I47_00125 [Sphingomonas sp.]|nr:hypothetical protein [Sphingomonas sp.]